MPNQTVSAPGPAGDRASVAAYVAGLTGDLAAIARQHGMQTLAYLLDMARLEAETESRHGRGNGR